MRSPDASKHKKAPRIRIALRGRVVGKGEGGGGSIGDTRWPRLRRGMLARVS